MNGGVDVANIGFSIAPAITELITASNEFSARLIWIFLPQSELPSSFNGDL